MLICISILQRKSLQKKTAQKHFDWNNDDFRKLLGFVNMKHAKRKLPHVRIYVYVHRSVIKMRMFIKKFFAIATFISFRLLNYVFWSTSSLICCVVFSVWFCGPARMTYAAGRAMHWLYSFFFWSYRFVQHFVRKFANHFVLQLNTQMGYWLQFFQRVATAVVMIASCVDRLPR